jgi:thioredoxin 1
MKKHSLIFTAAALLFIGSCASSPREKSSDNTTGTEVSGGRSEAYATGSEISTTGSEISTTGSDTHETADAVGEGHATKKLNKTDFLAKVMNYEKNTKEWVFEGNKPCLIDFYADWCAPCRITSPILEELAKEYGNKIDIYKIDTEKERELAAIFGIQSLPSFLFVPLNGMPTMSSGIARSPEETKQMFRQQIDQLLLQ